MSGNATSIFIKCIALTKKNTEMTASLSHCPFSLKIS